MRELAESQGLGDPLFRHRPSQPAELPRFDRRRRFRHSRRPAELFRLRSLRPASACNKVAGDSLVGQLRRAGLTFAIYAEDLPEAGSMAIAAPGGPSGALYAQKHNPVAYFEDLARDPSVLSQMKPYSDFAADLASGPPSVAFIVPNQCHDGHGLPVCRDRDRLIADYDSFVREAVTAIRASKAWTRRSAIVVTFDEGARSLYPEAPLSELARRAAGADNHIATIVVTRCGAPLQDADAIRSLQPPRHDPGRLRAAAAEKVGAGGADAAAVRGSLPVLMTEASVQAVGDDDEFAVQSSAEAMVRPDDQGHGDETCDKCVFDGGGPEFAANVVHDQSAHVPSRRLVPVERRRMRARALVCDRLKPKNLRVRLTFCGPAVLIPRSPRASSCAKVNRMRGRLRKAGREKGAAAPVLERASNQGRRDRRFGGRGRWEPRSGPDDDCKSANADSAMCRRGKNPARDWRKHAPGLVWPAKRIGAAVVWQKLDRNLLRLHIDASLCRNRFVRQAKIFAAGAQGTGRA